MQNKAKLGRTKEYSGVANAVKSSTAAKKPPEPTIRPEHIVSMFRSFGFEPNKDKSNDMAYWSMQPQSMIKKMVEDLKKRRDTENAKNQNNHMSDARIISIFKEYGIPMHSLDHIKANFPLEENKMRGVLDIHRKTMDATLKNHSKAITKPPEPNNGSGGPGYGMGGPGTSEDVAMSTDIHPTSSSPFFIGEHALARISVPNNPHASSVWLIDPKNKVMRPFLSEHALNNAFEDPEAAKKSIVNISHHDLAPGGMLDGYKMLDGNHGVQHDGSMPDLKINPAHLQYKYGQPHNPFNEHKALSLLDSVFNQYHKKMSASKKPSGTGGPGYDGAGGPGDDTDDSTDDVSMDTYGQTDNTSVDQNEMQQLEGFMTQTAPNLGEIDPQFLNTIVGNPSQMAAYASALAYGGYSIGDVWSDMKAQQLSGQGNTAAGQMQFISPTLTSTQFAQTPAGQETQSNQYSLFGGQSPIITNSSAIMQYGLNDIPSALFNKIVPQLDPTTTQGQTAMDAINTGMYDLTQQTMNAQTAQQQQAAAYNYQSFAGEMNDIYGIQLGNTIEQAWGQIGQLQSAYGQRGIPSSGLENQDVESYLTGLRGNDANMRQFQNDKTQAQQQEYYQNYATPAEVDGLVQSNPQLAQQYGLVSPATITLANGQVVPNPLAGMTASKIMGMSPGTTLQQANDILAEIQTPGGNLQSTTYENAATQDEQSDAERSNFQQTQAIQNSETNNTNTDNANTPSAAGTYDPGQAATTITGYTNGQPNYGYAAPTSQATPAYLNPNTPGLTPSQQAAAQSQQSYYGSPSSTLSGSTASTVGNGISGILSSQNKTGASTSNPNTGSSASSAAANISSSLNNNSGINNRSNNTSTSTPSSMSNNISTSSSPTLPFTSNTNSTSTPAQSTTQNNPLSSFNSGISNVGYPSLNSSKTNNTPAPVSTGLPTSNGNNGFLSNVGSALSSGFNALKSFF